MKNLMEKIYFIFICLVFILTACNKDTNNNISSKKEDIEERSKGELLEEYKKFADIFEYLKENIKFKDFSLAENAGIGRLTIALERDATFDDVSQRVNELGEPNSLYL